VLFLRTSIEIEKEHYNGSTVLKANKSIGKSWADGITIGSFSFFSFGLGLTSNTGLFIVNFNKIFSIINGCGQKEFYFPTFANT